MKFAARRTALETLSRIETDEAYSTIALDESLHIQHDMDPRDKALATEIVYGTLTWQRLLDFQLQPLIKQPLDQLDPWVKILLRLSAYQILFLDRIPHNAAVHEAVEIAKKKAHKGIAGFVNGVLRNFLRGKRKDPGQIEDPIERIGVTASHPDWMVRRWVDQFGLDRATAICQANNERPPLTIRVNALKTDRSELRAQLRLLGYDVREAAVAPEGLHISKGAAALLDSPAFRDGLFSVQDEGSMLVAPLVDPQPGMRVLDMCAAPGGKTMHMAERMNNDGVIIANDVHKHKDKKIQQSSRRLGIDIVQAMTGDARKIERNVPGLFDRVLVDAPCSGLGVIRRKPDLKWTKQPEHVKEMVRLQLQLLSAAAKMVKEGGTLVYSTCTTDEQENAENARRFIEQHPQFQLDEQSEIQWLPGIGQGEDAYRGDGFYMVKFNRLATGG